MSIAYSVWKIEKGKGKIENEIENGKLKIENGQ